MKKFLSSMMYKRWIHKYQTLSLNLPERRALESLLKTFEPDLYQKYHPGHGTAVMVIPMYKSVEDYTKKLKELSRLVKDKHALSPEWSNNQTFEISVDRFLTSADGYYLDVCKAVREFKIAALQLTQLMEESDNASHGIYEHNLRMLTKLFVNLRGVTQQLVEVSLTNE